jgi:transaldolase
MELFSDSGSFKDIEEMSTYRSVVGFTTNPTLLRVAGVENFKQFAFQAIRILSINKAFSSISLEVFGDTPNEILNQARTISSWEYDNVKVFVKIPYFNTKGECNLPVVKELWKEGVRVNLTAMLSDVHLNNAFDEKDFRLPETIFSIFAGRINDASYDVESFISNFKATHNTKEKGIKILWASCRQIYSYKTAEKCGCDIITMTPDQIKKMRKLSSKNLDDYAIETSKMFFDDGVKSGYTID